jgi:hypothetical protein
MLKRLATGALGAAMLLSVAAGAVAAGNPAGPPSLSFYADGVRWRTVGTPTDFTNTGAPDSSFEAIYALGQDANGDPLINVAEAAPGDPGFRGGRWMVLPVTWHTTPVQLTTAADVHDYASMGLITISDTPAKEFECPVIRAR